MLALLVTEASAQLRIEQVPLSPIKSNTGFFVYGANHLNREIPYSKINGTPFWNTEFMSATLYLTDGQSYGPSLVKLNIATNEVNFLNSTGEEFIAQAGIIKKIVFHKTESSDEVQTIFRNNIDIINIYAKFKDLFVQELNQGTIQLLKISKKILMVADSLFGTQKKYTFYLEESYFVKQTNRIHSLKKLNSKEILTLLHLNSDLENWIDNNKMNLSKEKDVLQLFDHLNSKKHGSDRDGQTHASDRPGLTHSPKSKYG